MNKKVDQDIELSENENSVLECSRKPKFYPDAIYIVMKMIDTACDDQVFGRELYGPFETIEDARKYRETLEANKTINNDNRTMFVFALHYGKDMIGYDSLKIVKPVKFR